MERGVLCRISDSERPAGSARAHHDGVNQGSAHKLLTALGQVLAECVTFGLEQREQSATKGWSVKKKRERDNEEEEEDDALKATLNLPSLPIPDGGRQSLGSCGRLLKLNDANFRRDGKRHKNGVIRYRGRCK